LNTPTELNAAYVLAQYRGEHPPAPAWFRVALERAPERSHFNCAGANIELLTWGTRGKPGLLFLHGNGAHADWWSHIAPFFSDDWRCAALSWSGMGQSDRRAEAYTVDIFAQEAIAAAHAAGLLDAPRLPIIISHSLGGMAGMIATALEKPLFGGLVLIDSPIRIDPNQLHDIRVGAPKARAEHRSFQTLEDGLTRFRLSPPQECENDFIADHIARKSLIKTDEGWHWHFDPRRVHIDAGRSLQLIDHVRSPVAYIHGERSAILSSQTLTLSLAALPAHTPIIAVPDAAHHVMIDQPLALVSALRALLSGWPPSQPQSQPANE
jgi:pimeloyl-ACP methyl ester carboxylesterase